MNKVIGKSLFCGLPIFLILLSCALGQPSASSSIFVDSSLGEAILLEEAGKQALAHDFHLFSHGRAGELWIEGRWRTAPEIVQWLRQGNWLSDKTALYLYGCEFAKGGKGKDAVKYLEEILHISVAASDNLTGKEGDWELEVGNLNGSISLQTYPFTLQDTDGDGVNDADDLDDDNDGILDTDENDPNAANQICEVVFTEDFGTGTSRVDISTLSGSATTGLNFDTNNNLADNEYGIDDSEDDPYGQWSAGGDNSADPNGRFMAINAGTTADDLYTRTISVVAGRTVQVQLDIRNLLRVGSASIHDPNVSFEVRNLSGTVLGSVNTGDVPRDETWHTYSLSVNVGYESSLEIALVNNKFETNGNDLGMDNIIVSQCQADTDNDGIANELDLDSDNDGIADILEAGGTDSDGDGEVDYGTAGDPTTMTDADGDGLADAVDDQDSGSGGGEVTNGTPWTNPDTDSDGLNNVVDIDSDNDGITDNVEAQTTSGYTAPSGSDTDGDGIDNAYDGDDNTTTGIGGGTGTAISPTNTDSDATADYLDSDSDDDGVNDVVEGHDTNGDGTVDGSDSPNANTGLAGGSTDADLDGLLDGFDNNTSSWDATNGSLTAESHPDVQPGTSEQDWREGPDWDGDGVADSDDLDDDNDGILDTDETGALTCACATWTSTTASSLTENATLINITAASSSGFDSFGSGVWMPGDCDGYTRATQTDGSTVSFSFSSPLERPTFSISSAGYGGDYGVILTFTDGSGNPIDIVGDFNSSVNGGGTYNIVGNVVTTTDQYAGELKLAEGAYNQVNILYQFNDIGGGITNPTDFAFYTLSSCTDDIDTDSDGIVDRLDLDSDGDGCSDAEEGAGSFTIAAGHIQNDTLTGGVDANGVPTAATASGQGVGDAQDSGTASCACPHASYVDSDGDGIDNVCDLDDDNDGIVDSNECPEYTVNAHSGGSVGSIGTYATQGTWAVYGDLTIFGDTDNYLRHNDGTGSTPHLVYNLNPDHGEIELTIADLDEGETYNLRVYDESGTLIPDVSAYLISTLTNGGTVTAGTASESLHFIGGVGSTPASTESAAIRLFFPFEVSRIEADRVNAGSFTVLWGITSATQLLDSDNDGIPNCQDLDSDNDGITDILEAGGTDSDGDGEVDYGTAGDPSTMTDADGDGLADAVDNIDSGSGGGEVTSGTAWTNPDTDSDGLNNVVDIDSDNDGITDNVEAQTTSGYTAPSGSDTDGDGIDNAYDGDDNTTTGIGGGTGTAISPTNTDSDATADYLDSDSDDDGVNDVVEGHDTNGDGTVDGSDSPNANTGLAGGSTDADSDGLLDGFDNNTSSWDATNGSLTAESHPDVQAGTAEQDWREGPDWDGDGVIDLYDLDDDNDGIPDTDEGYVAPSLTTQYPVSLNSSLSGSNAPLVATNFFTINRDCLEDLIAHIEFATLTGDNPNLNLFSGSTGMQISYSGLSGTSQVTYTFSEAIDVSLYLNNNRWDEAVTFFTPYDNIIPGPGSNIVSTNPVVWHNNNDASGYTEFQYTNVSQIVIGVSGSDLNQVQQIGITYPDNASCPDSDLDNISSYLDLDSDGDGIVDIIEAGGTDSNGDGLVDVSTDTDGDGLVDTYDNDDTDGPDVSGCTFGVDCDLSASTSLLLDTDANGTNDNDRDEDSDGYANYVDIDSDADGIVDNNEAQGTSAYVAPSGTDTDGDGIDDAYDVDCSPCGGVTGVQISPVNTDGEADNPDYLDTDSDEDGESDTSEAYDSDDDGSPNTTPAGTDTDGDGLDDNFDSNVLSSAASTNANDNGETPAGFPNTDIVGGEPNWREATAGGAAAPIELLSFTVYTLKNGQVKILWKTLTETNNDFFTIERSRDAENWEELIYVKGAGDSQEILSYQEIDRAPFLGTSYYRLKQTDFNGDFSYSSIMEIYIDPGLSMPLTLYPNPTKGPLIVEGSPDELSSFTFYDVLGKDVTAQVRLIYRDDFQIQLNLSRLPRGVYLLKTENETVKIERE